ncbi:hypothetical protein H206_05329 [Candidatus Electrothrix aarhusensis]|uniref:Uncharacterized protein n=1 Tax=Candidatus Electrothrix aarhusensis TaxID=1859131 RepID=A0A444J4V9_9BACT|nr:hypothetical protein H206_05329 [Candidatus Electrothrix aarhusensis]
MRRFVFFGYYFLLLRACFSGELPDRRPFDHSFVLPLAPQVPAWLLLFLRPLLFPDWQELELAFFPVCAVCAKAFSFLPEPRWTLLVPVTLSAAWPAEPGRSSPVLFPVFPLQGALPGESVALPWLVALF